VTKTNRFTLIATILLGILLFTILRFAHDLNVAWDGGKLKPPPATDDTRASTRPRIATTTDLHAFLDQQGAENGIDSTAILNDFAKWSDARGFTGRNRLFGTADTVPSGALTANDDDVLRMRSDAGDAAASQALAERILFVDLYGAIELFRRAAEQGSTFALLRIGALLEALDATGTGYEIADPAQRQRVVDLTEQGVGNSLRLTALGYILVAIRDGGAPVVDGPQLTQLDRFHDETTNDEWVAVCEWSENTLLNIARARIRWGKPAVVTVAPPIFFSVPDLADRLPCSRTAYPIDNLMDLTHCTITPVRNADDEALDLYLCPAG